VYVCVRVSVLRYALALFLYVSNVSFAWSHLGQSDMCTSASVGSCEDGMWEHYVAMITHTDTGCLQMPCNVEKKSGRC